MTETAAGFGPASFPIPLRVLQKILYALLIAVPCSAIPLYFAHRPFPAAILGMVEIGLAVGVVAAHRGNARLAGWLVLGPLTICVALLNLAGKGPLDESLLAIPGLMIFASLFGNRKVFLGILLFFMALLLLVAIAHFRGWRPVPVGEVRLDTFITVAAILCVTSYVIWQMAYSLRVAVKALRIENERVRKSLAQIEFLAHHDALTGLPNRALARDRFAQAIALARRNGSGAALLYLDLDNFKLVNDSLGHAGGDALLYEVAARLKGAVRAHDTVSRQGGDEFLVVLGEIGDKSTVAAIAHKLIEKMALPFHIHGHPVTATCSLGIAMYPGNGPDFESLLKRADQAMYQAKASGRNACRFFESPQDP